MNSSRQNVRGAAVEIHDPQDAAAEPAVSDGFEPLDLCHRHTIFTLGRLAALLTRLSTTGADAEARSLAKEVMQHFSTTVRLHHEDEERHVFPPLLASGDPETVQTVQRLMLDHSWLNEDWAELSPHLDAVCCGQSWYDIDLLREGCDIFSALSREHIALEESLIYPQMRSRLEPAQRREMGREMAARRRGRTKLPA